jgi:formylglycine-generating enzyme required for sulfatase activity
MKSFLFFVISLSFFVEVNAQPKTLYGIKIAKFIPAGGYIETPFYMDETPITYEDFKKYVRAGGKKTAYWEYESYNINEQPVTGISWHHAVDYCNWRSKCEGLQPVYFKTDSLDDFGYPIYERDTFASGYRLPTEDEFSSAA